jgi:hypothetical protein
MTEGPLQLVHAPHYPQVRELLLEVYREIYTTLETAEFHDTDRFAERADNYARLDGWSAVIGRDGDDEITTYAFGAPLPPRSR